MQLTDLAASLAQHDPEALAAVDRRHRAALLSHARRLLAATGIDPDDVVQDTLERAWTRPPAPGVPLGPWLHVVLRNRALDLLRSPAVSRMTVAQHEPVAPGDPAAIAESRQELRDLTAAMRRLPGRQSSALVLHALEGRPHHEIARRLGTSDGGAKALVHRARRQLGSELARAA